MSKFDTCPKCGETGIQFTDHIGLVDGFNIRIGLTCTNTQCSWSPDREFSVADITENYLFEDDGLTDK